MPAADRRTLHFVTGRNYTLNQQYPIPSLTVTNTGREDEHTFCITADAITRKGVRTVNVYLSRKQLIKLNAAIATELNSSEEVSDVVV